MWRNSVARGGGEGQNGESRGKPASMLGFDIKKTIPHRAKPYTFFPWKLWLLGEKGIGFFSFWNRLRREKDNLTAIFSLHFLEAIDLWKYCMCLINNCLDDFSKPLPFFSVWRQCMLRVWLFKWVGGVWRRMCFCPDLVFSSSGSSLFTVRYLPFAIYKEYCGCRVRKWGLFEKV